MNYSSDSKSNDNDSYNNLIFKENKNSIFLGNKRSSSSLNPVDINFSFNIFNSQDLNDNNDPFNLLIKSNNDNKQDLSHIFIKSNSEEIKTKEASNNKTIEKLNINIKNDEQKIPEIIRNERKDNDKIKIKLAVSKSYIEKYNKNVKDENLKIDKFDFDKFKNISIINNLLLGKTTWEEIILHNYIGNKDAIKNIIKNIYDNKEKDAIKLLEMTFNEYLEIFIQNNLQQFLENEKENQIKKYKQKKYKETIDKLISDKKVETPEIFKKYVIFGVKNKNVKKQLNLEENLFKDFIECNYKISKENEFESFLKQKYEISFDLTQNEINDIDKYINNLRDLVKTFDKWFDGKTPKKSRKKMFQIISEK